MPLVEVKHFNALVHDKLCFDQPEKSKQEPHEKLMEMPGNIHYTTGNLLDFTYHQNYDKLIGIDLSIQTNINISQQINFAGKLEEYDRAAMFFNAGKLQETILNFSLDSLTLTN